MIKTSFSEILLSSIHPMDGAKIGVIGGGGKTAFMFEAGRVFAGNHRKTLITSITKAGRTDQFQVNVLKQIRDNNLLNLFETNNPVYLLNKQIKDEKYSGLSIATLEQLVQAVDVAVFECDGSRNLPLKAHNNADPHVPEFATHTVIVIGADVVDTTLSDGLVHRPDLFRNLWAIENNQSISCDLIGHIVTSKKGYLSKVPEGMPLLYVINKADEFPLQAEKLAHSIGEKISFPVYWGSVMDKWLVSVK